ncbi:MAG: AraC family transcriptional regulator [Flavihumibacter sp.]|nr:AraC family transcriptional regulator [Flavihumibacter sp.]
MEFGVRKNQAIQLNSFGETKSDCLRIYCINEGRFEWVVNGKTFLLFPGDVVLSLPNDKLGHEKSILEIGTISWIFLNTEALGSKMPSIGKWSGLNENEQQAVARVLFLSVTSVISNPNDCGRIFHSLINEIHNQSLGFTTRFNQLIDELLITIARKLTQQNNPPRDFPKAFMQLEQSLRMDLSHQWTVEEMAAITGMGTTIFNEKVKSYSGFTPINYLINIRISEAIKMLKKKEKNITDIALETGFYSSQHFSTTFKKLTGYTPGEFRKNNLLNE